MNPVFAFELHAREKELLVSIQNYFGGVGHVNLRDKSVSFRISSTKELSNVIIPHLDKYPLITQKFKDYLIFKEIVDIIQRKEHLTPEGLDKIAALKASLNNGLSAELKSAFPNIVPANRSLFLERENQDIPRDWFAGFATAEGCFYISMGKSTTHRTGVRVYLRFTISQHSRDEALMKSLLNFLGTGKYQSSSSRASGEIVVAKFSDIINIIRPGPLFTQYPILGTKGKDLEGFCLVSDLMSKGLI